MQYSGWEQVASLCEKHANQNSTYLKLQNDGDSVVGAFCGDPFAREVLWTGTGYEDFDEHNPDHQGQQPSSRIAFNFYVPALQSMKVFECGVRTAEDILRVVQKYGRDAWLFEIRRRGEKGSPKTSYSILPDNQVSAALAEEMASAQLHDLSRRGGNRGGEARQDFPRSNTAAAPQAAAPASPQRAETTDPAPTLESALRGGDAYIKEDVARALVDKLRELPQVAVSEFLQRFGVDRVRNIRASQELAARRFADDLAHRAPSADPFG